MKCSAECWKRQRIEVINISNFCNKIFISFRSTGDQNPRFPIDLLFAGYRHKLQILQCCAITQPVMNETKKPRWRWQTRATLSMLKFASVRHGNKLQTSYRGNDLFKVMQQPSAPSGEWYWRILLENGLFSPPRTCLTPHSGWTPCDIDVTCTSLKSAFDRWATIPLLTIRVFTRLAVIASETREMSRNSKRIWPYSTAVKVIDLVSMESPYVTSY